MIGIGPVLVKVPRVPDRAAGDDKVTFTPGHPATLSIARQWTVPWGSGPHCARYSRRRGNSAVGFTRL
jgi:hypothetical protein